MVTGPVGKGIPVIAFQDGLEPSIAQQVSMLPLVVSVPSLSSGNCPLGIAWADRPYDVSSAHQLSECSGVGTCDPETGICECYAGYTGDACQRSLNYFPHTPDKNYRELLE